MVDLFVRHFKIGKSSVDTAYFRKEHLDPAVNNKFCWLRRKGVPQNR